MSSADTKLGYELEDELKAIFKELQETNPIFWHQFPDTKSARNFIAAQPSDFLVGSPFAPMALVEAKASEMKPSLAACAKAAIRPSQIGMHMKWHRAGYPSLFIFYCQADNVVELWEGSYVVSCISAGTRMKSTASDHLLAKCDYFDLKDMMFNHFCKA